MPICSGDYERTGGDRRGRRIDGRNRKDVVWAMAIRMDPAGDITLVENTPIDYLDFASPESGLGLNIRLDAITHGRPRPRESEARRFA